MKRISQGADFDFDCDVDLDFDFHFGFDFDSDFDFDSGFDLAILTRVDMTSMCINTTDVRQSTPRTSICHRRW